MKIENEFGKMSIGPGVFARIAADAAGRFSDRVLLATEKGRPVHVGQSGHEKLDFIRVSEDQDTGRVDIHINAIIRTGTDPEALAVPLGRAIRADIKDITGIEDVRITLVILGIKTKSERSVSKEFMEVSC